MHIVKGMMDYEIAEVFELFMPGEIYISIIKYAG